MNLNATQRISTTKETKAWDSGRQMYFAGFVVKKEPGTMLSKALDSCRVVRCPGVGRGHTSVPLSRGFLKYTGYLLDSGLPWV